jgi:ectoine hydroxylase-related dioxygenase (phytanoyl-CoA dioxygenase family)
VLRLVLWDEAPQSPPIQSSTSRAEPLVALSGSMSHPSITEDDIRRYERDGAVLIRGALDPDTSRLIEQGVEETYRAAATRSTIIDGADGQGRTVVRDYASLTSATLRALLADGLIGRIGATIMRTSAAHLVLDQIFYKTQGPIVPTPWHQDTPFLRVRGDSLIRLWFPCDYSPREITVQVVRGSHRWNVVYNSAVNSRMSSVANPGAERTVVGDSSLPQPPDVHGYRDSFDILSWEVAPGDVVAFQGNMLHGADGHPGHDKPRRALAVLMGGPELRYHVPRGKAFPSPGRMQGLVEKDDIPDGAPIGEYSAAFPICWRAGAR